MNDSPEIPDDEIENPYQSYDYEPGSPEFELLGGDDGDENDLGTCPDCGEPYEDHQADIILEKYHCEICQESLNDRCEALILNIGLILSPGGTILSISNPVGVPVHRKCLSEYFDLMFKAAANPEEALPFDYDMVGDEEDHDETSSAFTLEDIEEDHD